MKSEARRSPKTLRAASWRPNLSFDNSRTVFDIFWGAHGLLSAFPGLLRVGFGGVLNVFGGAFWLIFSASWRPNLSFDHSRMVLISSGVLMGYSWPLLGCSGSAWGVFWVSLEVLFGSFSLSGEGFEAKTSKCLKMMTLSLNLLYFRGPKASRMRSKSTPKREKVSNGERESRRAEKRATLKGKAAYPRYCMRFRGGPGAEGTRPDDGNIRGSGAC